MQILTIFSDFPNQIQNTTTHLKLQGTALKKCIATFANKKFKEFKKSYFWTHQLFPLYQRHIKPINKEDLIILGASAATSAIIIVVTTRIFGMGALPMVTGTVTFLNLGAIHVIKERAKKHLNKKTLQHLKAMETAAKGITSEHHNFATILEHSNHLNKPVFHHLETEIKQLDEEFRRFRDAILHPQLHENGKEDAKKVYLQHLQGLKAKIA